jgi:hypothetical protein
MMRCEFCGLELPANAQFCGNCGHKVVDKYATWTDYAIPPETSIPERQTPPLFSSPMNPNLGDSGMGLQDTDSTYRTIWSYDDTEQVNPQFAHRITDENDDVIPEALLPGMLAMQGQLPSPSQAPMVQGTPQIGAVPSVQGTPAAPGNVPQSIPGPVHGAASSAPSYAPQEAQPIPEHYQQVQQPAYQSSTYHNQPASPPHEQEHHHRHHSGSLHEHKPHSTQLQHSAAATSKAGMSAVSKWIIITVVTLVIVGSSSILLTHALMPPPPPTPPVLTITGSSAVKDGGVMHIHGQGFQPGDGVTLTIDNGLPVSLAGQHGTQAVSQGTGKNVQVTGLSQMNIAGALQPHSAAGINITVSSAGTFDANVTVPSNLAAGKHTIRAKDNQRSLSASLQFTVSSSQLVANPTALNFGSVEVGRTVKLLVTLSNQSGASLRWTATVDGSNTNWLAVSKSSEVIGANGSSGPIIVTANTNGLSLGQRTATLHFHSDNGDVQIPVKINVISIGQSGQQAILNVSQQSLDFGQLQAGQQAQQSIAIANLGNLPLQWQASSDAASATWLSLAATSGTVQTGAAPQSVQVKVDTTGLTANSYSGTIHITSNGGNAQVRVTLVVTSATQTLKVTGINPSSGPAAGGTNVTITGTGFTGATNVSFGSTAATNVNVKSDNQITVTSPAGSGTVDVTVTTPSGTSATSSADLFTYIKPTTVTVTGISPTSGPAAGGTPVTITGTGFTGATNVSFGKTAGSIVNVISDTQITATSPIGCGTVDVTVTTPGGTSATSTADQFTYTYPLPTVTSISPTSGPAAGGTSVTITGTGFNCATGVSFGTAAGSNMKVVNDTQITVTSPAGNGTVDVTITTPGGTSATSTADQFTYIPPPTITAIKPNSGLTTGGSNVTISGTAFTGATSVSFGQTAASIVSVSDTQITVTSPAGSGTVDVTVTTPGGTSATSSADVFTYTTPSPTWSVNTTSLDASTCGQTAPCQVTLTEDANSTGDISWSASSNIGATFKPQSGTLSPTGQNSVTITIVAPCQSDTFTFNGQAGVKQLSVSWNCSSLQLTLSPSSSTSQGGTQAGIFTYYYLKNGLQSNAVFTLPALPPESQTRTNLMK